MPEPIEIIRGETGAILSGSLSALNGILPDLVGATVTVTMRSVNGAAPVLQDAPCTIDNETAAPVVVAGRTLGPRHVYHQFSAADFTALSADAPYRVQFKVVRADAKVVYAPNRKKFMQVVEVIPAV